MKILYEQEVYRFIGVAMEVHSVLGPEFAEPIYHEALAMECSWREIPYVSEQQLNITYKGAMLKKYYIADMVMTESLWNSRHLMYWRTKKSPNFSTTSKQPISVLAYSSISVPPANWNGND